MTTNSALEAFRGEVRDWIEVNCPIEMRKPFRSALRCDALPGEAPMMARSQPCAARYFSRQSSSAACAPCRRPSGTVLAPASSPAPCQMNKAAVAMATPSISATMQVA